MSDSSDSDSSGSEEEERQKKKKGKDRRKKKGKKEVKTKKVSFEGGQTRQEEIDEITKQLPKLHIHDAGYATAYVRLQVLAPEIAAFLQKPGEVGHNHTFQSSAASGGPARTYSWPFACYFCADLNHCVLACLILIEYIKVGRVMWKDKKLFFSGETGEKVPFNPDGLKIEVDKCYGSPIDLTRALGEHQREPFRRETAPHMIPTASTSFIRAEGVALAVITDEKKENVGIEKEVRMDQEGEDEEIWAAFEELEVGETLVTTRSGTKIEVEVRKRHGMKGDAEKKMTGKKGEIQETGKDIPKQANADKAYTYESRAADPEAIKKLYNRLLKVEVPNVTVGNLVSLSGDLQKILVKNLRTTRIPTTDTALLVQEVPNATSLYAKTVPLEYCTPLREVEVKLAGGIVNMGLLDDGSEIVVV